jgi:hypothetical protein
MRKVKFSTIFVLISISLVFTTYVDVFADMALRNTSEKLNERDIKAAVEKLNLFDK